MKNKTKKIFAGIGLAFISTGLLAGCSSDITFNQSDLDRALLNINDYLETQNNYSSEFAKNMLNDYLLRGIERNQNNLCFGYKVSNYEQNMLNDSSSNFVSDYKIYRSGNTIKELCKVTGTRCDGFSLKENTTNYREMISEYKIVPVEWDGGVFSKNFYYSGDVYSEEFLKTSEQYSKTTFKDKSINELESWMIFGDITNIYSNLMLSVIAPDASCFGPAAYFSNQTDVVMGKEGDFETFTFTNVFAETLGNESGLISFNIKFNNGVLHSITFTNMMKRSAVESFGTGQVITVEISEKIEDFSFDKTPY